ncbi:hypothetical protein [Mucilaginibacter sp.]|uniref:hypothetical protein n=1 Tax=Mucilaginibacter sp. TaxID=1882438 RepID=UPI002843F0ED|nr:hypothetical protein [Mucilaginibacter sp.]MDR3697545.1 hypothetical protein [Mucilaginibacter sp.]
MRILSFQPGSLYGNGGAARVLRHLYQGRESQVFSIGLITSAGPIQSGLIPEQLVAAYPLQRKWMRWRLRNGAIWLRERGLTFLTKKRICKIINRISYDVFHMVSHGAFCGVFDNDLLFKEKKRWVSFHDHFSTNGCSMNQTKSQWHKADRRLVISNELGIEYQRLFGHREFEIITDGLTPEEVSKPSGIDLSGEIIIYFAGLLHIDYYPLLKVLAEALDELSRQDFKFKLMLRGVGRLKFLDNKCFEIEYRTDFISDDEIKLELDSASVLYLPIKFTLPDFYLYSLSTKMVGYLGACGSILYHGPEESAACHMLKESGAAECCSSIKVVDMIKSIEHIINSKNNISARAKILVEKRFNFNEIQKKFWQL